MSECVRGATLLTEQNPQIGPTLICLTVGVMKQSHSHSRKLQVTSVECMRNKYKVRSLVQSWDYPENKKLGKMLTTANPYPVYAVHVSCQSVPVVRGSLLDCVE